MSFPTALYASCTQLRWNGNINFSTYKYVYPPQQPAPNLTEHPNCGRNSQSEPQSRMQGHFCKGYLPSSAQHNIEIQQSTAVFYPSCLKFTFSSREDRIGASLRTEAELLTAMLAPASRQVWEPATFPTLLRQVTWFVMAAAAPWYHCTSQGKSTSFPASQCQDCFLVPWLHPAQTAEQCNADVPRNFTRTVVLCAAGLMPAGSAMCSSARGSSSSPHHPSGDKSVVNLAPKTASVCPTTFSAHCSWATIHL